MCLPPTRWQAPNRVLLSWRATQMSTYFLHHCTRSVFELQAHQFAALSTSAAESPRIPVGPDLSWPPPIYRPTDCPVILSKSINCDAICLISRLPILPCSVITPVTNLEGVLSK